MRSAARTGFRRAAVLAVAASTSTTARATIQDGPPAPTTDEFDWMQFNNGAWLEGAIKDLQDDSFVLESDRLDTHSLRAALLREVDVWRHLDLDFQLIWDRVNRPVVESHGTTPESDDVRVFVGIGWEL